MTRPDPAKVAGPDVVDARDGSERCEPDRVRLMGKVRWRDPWWSPDSPPKVRVYDRLGDAQREASRLSREGYDVELWRADAEPWRLLRLAPFSTGPQAEEMRSWWPGADRW